MVEGAQVSARFGLRWIKLFARRSGLKSALLCAAAVRRLSSACICVHLRSLCFPNEPLRNARGAGGAGYSVDEIPRAEFSARREPASAHRGGGGVDAGRQGA